MHIEGCGAPFMHTFLVDFPTKSICATYLALLIVYSEVRLKCFCSIIYSRRTLDGVHNKLGIEKMLVFTRKVCLVDIMKIEDEQESVCVRFEEDRLRHVCKPMSVPGFLPRLRFTVNGTKSKM
jgi:hypothetical protein